MRTLINEYCDKSTSEPALIEVTLDAPSGGGQQVFTFCHHHFAELRDALAARGADITALAPGYEITAHSERLSLLV